MPRCPHDRLRPRTPRRPARSTHRGRPRLPAPTHRTHQRPADTPSASRLTGHALRTGTGDMPPTRHRSWRSPASGFPAARPRCYPSRSAAASKIAPIPKPHGPRTAERHLVARRSAGRVAWVSGRSLTLPLTYLRSIGAAPRGTRSQENARTDGVLEAYRRYLCEERGLSAETQKAYLRVAGGFCGSVPAGGGGLDELSAQDVSAFVVAA